MPRKKLTFMCADLMEVDRAMAEAADLDRRIGMTEARLNEQVDALKAQAAADTAPSKDRRKELETAILDYGQRRKLTIFANTKTIELTHGTLSSRVTVAVKPISKWTWKMVLGRLIQLDIRAAIRVRQDVDKEELHKWPDERLATVGARRVHVDKVGYELKKEDLRGTE